jgi:hypothetical protein
VLAAALDWARQQEALSWELRAATSLAREQRRSRAAIVLHQPVYDRFDTVDLKMAQALLESLR